MSMWQAFKKWALKVQTQTPSQREETPLHLRYSSLVGEPVTSFIASLHREPKRYKLERVLRIETTEFPSFTNYHWMHGAGHYRLLDRKTGKVYAAYVHECGRVYRVYGLPFELNHWELEALWDAFLYFRIESRERKESIRTWVQRRVRLEAEAQEKLDRQRFAEQFK